jgi:hypothetical protein
MEWDQKNNETSWWFSENVKRKNEIHEFHVWKNLQKSVWIEIKQYFLSMLSLISVCD